MADSEISMLSNFKAWYRRRILKNESIPDDLWRQAVTRLRFLRGLDTTELRATA